MPVQHILIGQPISPQKSGLARQLRGEMTDAEKALWQQLRTDKLAGLHFRRQQVIDGYIVDFYCHALSLVIEVDGPIHDLQQQADAHRASVLVERGFHVIRFTNDEVLNDLPAVMKKILETSRSLQPPFPPREGAGG